MDRVMIYACKNCQSANKPFCLPITVEGERMFMVLCPICLAHFVDRGRNKAVRLFNIQYGIYLPDIELHQIDVMAQENTEKEKI